MSSAYSGGRARYAMWYLSVQTNYLEMRQRPDWQIAAAPGNCFIVRIRKPSPEYYLSFYKEIGARYLWVDRSMMKEQELREIIENDLVEMYVLYVANERAGFAELDRRYFRDIEIAYFGLFEKFVGRGLGKYFLRWIVKQAWEYEPRRLWVHTCMLDHKAALPNYLKVGFEIYDQKTIIQKLPDPQ